MKILSIGRERLYKRNYERESIQEITSEVNDVCIHEDLSRIVAKMITKA